MSMKFSSRDFKKNPLTRADTQILSGAKLEEEAPFRAQQAHNDGNRLDSSAILAQYAKTGIITHTRDHTARYLDATVLNDFREVMSVKAKADESFASLPAEIRSEKFNDDPKKFVEFCLNAENLDELRKMGLAAPVKTMTPPIKVEVITPVETTEKA